ncbi:DUF664 domain-containing protein [Sediminivirga luteola]|uniref:Uncharacterized protein n=1 Tax=Sediminivirga luteola TaxID=1774748 RepID=A0A8J2XL00_9MICO|nr:DUF664 domain-containing protein [Sediminivirga luteola]MCI2264123.1 DinB family protein [Sediminivirga luteola]GGA17976.1 hypothetical protein GCM10011333_21410 [Sediminivirga luteola]
MPFLAPGVTDERDAHIVFLAQQLEQVRIAALDLDEDQLRAVPTTSALSLAGLLAHIAQTTANWLSYIHAHGGGAETSGLSAQDFDMELAGFFSGAEIPPDDGAQLRERLQRAAALVRPVLAHADFDARVPVPDAPWFPADIGSWSVRWVAHHLIAEVARHAGHADLIRETLDGQIAYALNARDAGEEFDWEEYAQ